MTEVNWRLKSAIRKRGRSPELRTLEKKLDRMSTALSILIFVCLLMIFIFTLHDTDAHTLDNQTAINLITESSEFKSRYKDTRILDVEAKPVGDREWYTVFYLEETDGIRACPHIITIATAEEGEYVSTGHGFGSTVKIREVWKHDIPHLENWIQELIDEHRWEVPSLPRELVTTLAKLLCIPVVPLLLACFIIPVFVPTYGEDDITPTYKEDSLTGTDFLKGIALLGIVALAGIATLWLILYLVSKGIVEWFWFPILFTVGGIGLGIYVLAPRCKVCGKMILFDDGIVVDGGMVHIRCFDYFKMKTQKVR